MANYATVTYGVGSGSGTITVSPYTLGGDWSTSSSESTSFDMDYAF